MDEDRKYISSIAQQGPSVSTRIAPPPPAPNHYPSTALADTAADVVDRATFPGVRAFLRDAGSQIGAAGRSGNVAGAAGETVRATAALPLAIANDVLPLQALGGAADAGGRFISALFNGAADAGAQPAASRPAATPPVVQTPNPTDQRLAASTAPAPFTPTIITPSASATLPAPAAPAAPDAAGIISKTMLKPDGSAGKTTTWGGPGGRPMSELGGGSALVQLPDGRIVSEAAYAKAQAAQQPAADDPVQRQLAFIRELSSMVGGDPRTRDARLQGLLNAAGAGQIGSVQERSNASRQAAPLTAAQAAESGARTGETTARTAGQIALLAAKQNYLNAMQRGDTAAANAAAEQLRVLEGRDSGHGFLVVPGGTELNDMGQSITRPSRVFNTRTQQIVTDQPAGGKQEVPKYETGRIYHDAKGNRAKWDGAKWVPA